MLRTIKNIVIGLLEVRLIKKILINYYVKLAPLEKQLKNLKLLFGDSNVMDKVQYIPIQTIIFNPYNIKKEMINLFINDNKIHLLNGELYFSDMGSLYSLIDEILINEEYYFKSKVDNPIIIDCGTNVGFSIYYFKVLYPESKVIGFEPVDELREIALKNIKLNNFDNVEILPYAISDSNSKTIFKMSNNSSQAGSLTDRRTYFKDSIDEFEVPCRKLSKFINGPINYLKLDIEGSEDIVMEEIKGHLFNIQFIFIEYHHGAGLSTDRLTKILNILDNHGFEYHISKSIAYNNATAYRPLEFCSDPYSALIFAKNNRWQINNSK